MKQILQNLGTGETMLADVPCPRKGGGSILAETTQSLVSLGTEKMLIEFGKGSWLAKARSQPDKVKQVLQKIKTDGLFATLDAVRAKLDTPIPLGYCNVGSVLESDDIYHAGQRIVSNGPHAQIVSVPPNLTAAIPDEVSDEQAAFTVIGAIGLQGIRLLNPTLGERVIVSGLGLIGLLAVQILKANGCQVLGIDFDADKLALARQFGADTVDLSAGADPVEVAKDWTHGVGVDGVLITASTKSDELIHQAATCCRKRGRIVLVGVIGLNLRRADFYDKELSFQVSCSYGPGRYDRAYEQQGLDYPIGFVRWTEQRNFQAILHLMAEGKIDIAPLITHRFAFDDALDAYQAVSDPQALGILLDYGPPAGLDSPKLIRTIDSDDAKRSSTGVGDRPINLAFVGAGGFTTRMLLPCLPTDNVRLTTIVSGSGVSATHAAKKFGFEKVSSSFDEVLDDAAVDAVCITTPHNIHASMVSRALQAGKHVFVEKPLALRSEEIDEVQQAVDQAPDRCLLVGFNRRFSPHTKQMKEWLQACPGTKSIIITVNAGAIPAEHWTQDLEVGGGRIAGEACHFVDLARFLAGHSIASADAYPMSGESGRLGDCAALQLAFSDGSIATIHYLANGSKDFPKERIEVFAGGKVMVCDNFRKSKEIGGKHAFKTGKQDKGHRDELGAFVRCVREGGPPPIPVDELMEVSRTTIELAEQVRQRLS